MIIGIEDRGNTHRKPKTNTHNMNDVTILQGSK
jgi:hypothetical protein